jgi:energy-coupling factor transport system ATP-binding protein
LVEPALETNGLWFWYEDEGIPALRGVDLKVPRGEFVALVGANGSGKTTLAKHFNGLLRPRRGNVLVAGDATDHRSIGELARTVGFLFQHPEQQIFSATVRQEIAFGPRNLGLAKARADAGTEAALARFGLSDVADKPPAILGYGLRRRVTCASLAALDPPVLVLDEPTVGLDALAEREVLQWLVELHRQGRTIVLITHDMALTAEYAERVVVLHNGQIIADSPPESLFGQDDLLNQASLAPPPVVALGKALQDQGLQGKGLTVEAFCEEYIARTGDQAPQDSGQDGDAANPSNGSQGPQTHRETPP